MKRLLQCIVLLLTTHFVTSCSTTNSAESSGEASPFGSWDRAAMVTAAEPYAAQAAIEMIEKGGHAYASEIRQELRANRVIPFDRQLSESGLAADKLRPEWFEVGES